MLFDVSRFIMRNADLVRGYGYEVEQTSDFDLIRDSIDRIGKPYLTPELDCSKSDLSPANCFWLIVKKDGVPVALGGVRHDDVGDLVSEFWGRQFARHYSGGISSIASPVTDAIKGRVCYMGDLFVATDERRPRNINIVAAVSRIGFGLCYLEWRPDCVYSFIRKKDVERGAAAKYGFVTVIPNSKVFLESHPPRSNSECCAIITRPQIEYLIKSEC